MLCRILILEINEKEKKRHLKSVPNSLTYFLEGVLGEVVMAHILTICNAFNILNY